MKKDSYKESLKEYLLTNIPAPMLNANVGLIRKNDNNWFSMNLGETIEILEEDELFFLKNHINALFSNYKELEKKDFELYYMFTVALSDYGKEKGYIFSNIIIDLNKEELAISFIDLNKIKDGTNCGYYCMLTGRNIR